MKNKITFLILAFFAFSSLQAQDKEAHREKIKALKVAYITQELNMNSEVAQKFWPVYNQYEINKRELHKRENIDWATIGSINEARAEEMLKEYLIIEKEEYTIKKQLFTDLKKFLTAREIIKLHELEASFHQKLIREYRERMKGEKR
ncbi:hypothetical protein FK178_05830 [Antarcticibacterium arcticum]|uniref:Sensor of ECF-type sigma factor n=1 Tax=Antarcticibacterium arcticum TaxID=2585771 RepID=A0A5B8YH85_9FLAO|nr:hypothetical protein [Antarcticibacterium arcticum]QED37260.1 hypothetical protein FK178_05830 [Antarcticibacterium arcticum]